MAKFLLTFLFLITSSVFGQIEIKSVEYEKFGFKVFWDKNSEGDISGYICYWGMRSRNYTGSVDVVKNSCTLFIPDSLKSDSVFIAVRAYDTSLNVSDFSNELAFVPNVLSLDLNNDGIITYLDYQIFYKRYKAHKNKTSFKDKQQ